MIIKDIKAGGTTETPEGPGSAPYTPEALRRIPGSHEAASIVISKKEYEILIRGCERFRLLENYIMNNEYYSVDTMRALVGYVWEE